MLLGKLLKIIKEHIGITSGLLIIIFYFESDMVSFRERLVVGKE